MRAETENRCTLLANIFHRIEAALLCLFAKEVVCMRIRPKDRNLDVYVLSESEKLNDKSESLARSFLEVWSKEE